MEMTNVQVPSVGKQVTLDPTKVSFVDGGITIDGGAGAPTTVEDLEAQISDTEVEVETEIPREFVLNTPLFIGDKTIDKIDLDFRKLKGRDVEAIEQIYFRSFKNSNRIAPAMDKRFLKMLVAKLNGFNFPFLDDLDAEDYTGLFQRAFGFLGGKA
jgi:hypothetical protein